MQLKIQRSQRASLTNVIIFCLDIRADYSPEERDNIKKYSLGGQSIYNSRAARKHLDNVNAQLDRTQSRDLKEQATGLMRGAVSFALAKMQLNVTIASLSKGHHIECKDLEEMLEAEDTVRQACKNVIRYLEVANTFDGSEVLIEYENGEERIHLVPHAPPLLTYEGEAGSGTLTTSASFHASKELPFPGAELFRDLWSNEAYRKIVYVVGAVLAFIVLVKSCA